MTETLLCLDVSYLAHRAYHSTGGLSYRDVPTGVIYGLLRDLQQLTDRFGSGQFAFCFDGGYANRRALLPGYKVRKEEQFDLEKIKAKKEIARQIELLREEYLPELGYVNLFHAPGYEADDVIAAVVDQTTSNPLQSCVIVASDRDLFQLLRSSPGVGRAAMYNPQSKSLTGPQELAETFSGCTPLQWPRVKAIAGCTSDRIPGCKGVGEFMAAKFITGQIPYSWKVHRACREWVKSPDYNRNLKLVQLPFPGCPEFAVRGQPPVPAAKWERLFDKLGITSLPVPGASSFQPLKKKVTHE